jgi:hypothetical protein
MEILYGKKGNIKQELDVSVINMYGENGENKPSLLI